MFKSRTVARMDSSADWLTAGRKLQNNRLVRAFSARRGRKVVSEEVKTDVRIIAFSVAVLAVDDLGFGRMHLQPARCQSSLKIGH